jgi:anti-sigma B factor antagonist
MISELQDELIEYLEKEKPQQVLVSFEGVTNCSTSSINALLRAKKRVISTGGVLKLCCMSPQIRAAYKMLNLDGTVFDIYNETKEALATFEAE